MKKKKTFSRYTALAIIMLVIFTLIGLRLSIMQIVNAEDYMDRANTNSIRQISEAAPRGKILDKNGNILATNIQSYNLVYMENNEYKDKALDTFAEVFKLLNSATKKNDDGTLSKEQLLDELELKVNPYRFEFSSNDPDTIRAMELRFKKDRGLNDVVRLKLYKNTAENELTDEQKAKIDEELLKITPQEVFNYLVVKHDLWKLLGLSKEEEKALFAKKNNGEIDNNDIAKMLLQKYSAEEVRKFMVVKDAIYLQSFSGYKPVVIAANVSKETAFLFEQVKNSLPGIDVTLQPIRYYPNNELGSNFLGYISKINSANKDRYEERGYDISTDYIGTAGLESAFEDRLRGSKGGTTIKINKEGRKTEELFKLEPYPGQDMILTIDSRLQAITERALQERMTALQTTERLHKEGTGIMDTGNATRGAAVVLDVNTGGVLAMASLPGYDPNLFSVPGRLTSELSKQYFQPDLEAFGKQYIERMGLEQYGTTIDNLFQLTDPDDKKSARKDIYDIYPKPFYNYATSGAIPPGSTFKALTSIAALEEGVVTPNEIIYDKVHFSLPGMTNVWSCHSAHGPVDLKKALERSCNYYYYEVGNRLYNKNGLDSIAQYAWKFGLGYDPNSNAKQTTGIEIAEATGQVYNNTYSKNEYAFYSKYEIRNRLNAGVYYAGSGSVVRYTPINIDTNKADSDELSAAKEALKQKVAEYIKGDYDYKNSYTIYQKLKSDLVPIFQNLIAALPEEERSKYKESDPQNMAEAISTYVTFDVITQITTPGNIFNAAIGQGSSTFTPVQLANYVATLVNGGTRYSVHLVDKFVDASGNVVQEYKPQILDKVELKPETITAVKEGMSKVTDEFGTAAGAFNGFPIATGGKTGSATFKENGVQEKLGRTSYGLYVGFAPYDKPEIAVCVVIYDAGHGGYVADVARAIYEAYFSDDLKQIPGYVPKFNYTLNP
ncbi:penicillin-binding transpeptidase domain-containing protein [Clostridium thermarum]|uniref:penicillin-binding transpeptidase domain-containing protein n=1 Tax=Clostridium thermarum TaxID=1716543 RepID=UPI001122B587|nr:penicillin-binding transpeptidase domain-containing protein [Clostridium thermarum]